jgi:hypothetical protein
VVTVPAVQFPRFIAPKNECGLFFVNHLQSLKECHGKTGVDFPGTIYPRSEDVLRKTIVALCAIAVVGMLSPPVASARGGFGGGGFHAGGFHGGFGGGAFRGGGFRSGGWGWRGAAYGALGVGVGLGLAGGYYGGYPYDDGYDYPYGYGEYAEYGPWANHGYQGVGYGGCHQARLRVRTAYGWRWRPVQICD